MSGYLFILFAFLILAFLIRMPIALGMFSGCVTYFLVRGMNLSTLINKAAYGIYNSYILIAIPLFILTANVMNNSGITDRIFRFANSLVGKYRGGTAYVNILASLVFAGMTGSALADASGLGIIEIEQMKKEGYDAPFSCAITASTAIIGPTFPPSIPFVIYAMISGVSVGKMFIGGIIPALLLCLSLGVYVHFISKKRNYPKGLKYTAKQFIINTIQAIPALLTPLILLAGIYTGIMTPTEASAIATLYTTLISLFIYKTLTFKSFKKIIINTIESTGSIFLIIAAAYGFSHIIALEQVGTWLQETILDLSLSKNMFLFITNIIFIILGCFVDVDISEFVFVPIFIPLAQALEVDLVQFGVMLCLNMMVGLATPPFGMLLFISSGISGTPLKDVIREMIPILFLLFLVVLMVAYIPQVTLCLSSIMQF